MNMRWPVATPRSPHFPDRMHPVFSRVPAGEAGRSPPQNEYLSANCINRPDPTVVNVAAFATSIFLIGNPKFG